MQRLIAATSMIALLSCGASAQAQTAPKQFDVRTIKPSAIGNGALRFAFCLGEPLSTGVTLKMLIMEAYDVKAFQISGGPSWVATARWDLEAKVEGIQGRLPLAQGADRRRDCRESGGLAAGPVTIP